ncbi:MAG: hypothetical protein H7X77_05735, partial [Anaerolineae bacterium]|nr:hypothetical protein [Anaerolineae bacterium]
MSTRRFDNNGSPEDESPKLRRRRESGTRRLDTDNDQVEDTGPRRPEAIEQRAVVPRGASGSAARNSAHLPRTLTQIIHEANDKVVRGDLVDYVPIPTGFDPLDGYIGGGLRKTELILLGG